MVAFFKPQHGHGLDTRGLYEMGQEAREVTEQIDGLIKNRPDEAGGVRAQNNEHARMVTLNLSEALKQIAQGQRVDLASDKTPATTDEQTTRSTQQQSPS